MKGSKVSWFYESASERKDNGQLTRSSFGAFQEGASTKTLDDHFNDLYELYKTNNTIDIKKDIKTMMNRDFMEQYKNNLCAPVFEGFRKMSPGDPHIETIIENVNRFWDTKVRLYTESASMMGFLPIATLEFPVLLKQFFQSILKDIIEVETVKTPAITKHIRTRYMIDNQTGEEYEYPKCLWDGTWEKIYRAGKGLPIREEVVPLVSGRLWKYDIISNLTDGIPGMDQISLQFKIIGIQVGTEIIRLKGNGITVEFSTGGTLLNGDLDFKSESGTVIQDTISGKVDYKAGTIDLSSASGQVEGIVFSGYLSNEKNIRSTSVREERHILRFTIEDGPRWNMPFTIEEIEDAAALLDINYYNRMVDAIVECQELNECMTVIKFLQDEYVKYNGITTDIYKLESLAQTFTVNLNPPVGFAGDPFKYISSSIQFRLKSMIHQLTEATKLEKLSFVIVGNPMATQLMEEFVQWKAQQGANIGGITVNNSYGFSSQMGGNVRVVASNIYDAYTVDPVSETGKRELILHVYVYPTTPDHISFKHLKYTSHLFTSQSQTAYQSTNAPAGAYNIVTATSRFHTFAVQGIQGRLIMLNSDRVYGDPKPRPPIVGAPWGPLPGTPAPVWTP